MSEFDDVLEAVGPRLRRLRQERGTTLTDLATSTGISISTLSRLESGQRRPTLELLLPLARAHQVQLDELVDAPPTGDPRIHAKPIKRHHGAIVIPLPHPSGASGWLNDRTNRARLGKALTHVRRELGRIEHDG